MLIRRPMNYVDLKFMGLKVFLESTGDKQVDRAIRTVFRDDFTKSAPLSMDREDVKLVLVWRIRQEEERTLRDVNDKTQTTQHH
jgi:hypothetical protein